MSKTVAERLAEGDPGMVRIEVGDAEPPAPPKKKAGRKR